MKKGFLILLILLLALSSQLFGQEGDTTGDEVDEVSEITKTDEIMYESAPEELKVEPEVSFEELLAEAGKFYSEEEYFKALAALDQARQVIKLMSEKIVFEEEDDLNKVIKEREKYEGHRIKLSAQFVVMSGSNSFTVFHRKSFNKFDCVFDKKNGDISRQIAQLSRRQSYRLMGRVGFDDEGKLILYLEKIKPH